MTGQSDKIPAIPSRFTRDDEFAGRLMFTAANAAERSNDAGSIEKGRL